MFEVTRDPLEPQPLLDFVRKDESGAIVSFYGVVRGSSEGRRVLHLEYDAYVPMAVKEMQKIGDDLRSRWQITEVAMCHRIGRLEVGEICLNRCRVSPPQAGRLRCLSLRHRPHQRDCADLEEGSLGGGRGLGARLRDPRGE